MTLTRHYYYTTTTSDSSGLSNGAKIFFAVFGGLYGLMVLLFVFAWIYSRYKRSKLSENETTECLDRKAEYDDAVKCADEDLKVAEKVCEDAKKIQKEVKAKANKRVAGVEDGEGDVACEFLGRAAYTDACGRALV